MEKATSIPSNADLNTVTYLKVGQYHCSGDNITNSPTTHYFRMMVYRGATEGYDDELETYRHRIRILITYTGEIWIQRVSSGAAGGSFTYGSWQRIIDTTNYKDLTAFTYSTSEQWTGEYWIDGKKIYQKTVTWSNLSAGSISKAHNISNIDSIVDYKIFAKNSGGELFTFPCVYYGSGSSGTFYDTYMFVTKTYINCKSNISWSSHEFYATIKYTKKS